MNETIQPNVFPSASIPSFSSLPMTDLTPKLAGKKIKKIFLVLAMVAIIAGAVLLLVNLFFQKKPTAGKIVLTYWGLFEPEVVFQQVIDDYEKDHPKVKIQYRQSSLKEYRERLQRALEAGEGPDIFRIHQSWVPMFGPLLSPIPSFVYDAASFEKTFYPSAKESLKYQGYYVAIPLEFDGLALFYNEDLFKAIGKTPPTTWDELRDRAKELTVRDQQGKIRTSGVALGATNVDHWSDILGLMMLQNGADLSAPAVCTDAAGSVTGRICPAADALSYFTLFARADRVWDATLPSSTFAFATGSLAMYFGPSWRVFDIENFKKDYQSSLNYKIVAVPQLPEGNVGWSSFWVEAVSKKSSYQTEAWEFLKYLSSQEIMQKLYQTQSSLRAFGEPYSRTDMADLLKTQPQVAAFVQQAPSAKNWYLSSNTFDNGINDQMIKYYEDAVNAVNRGEEPLAALKTASLGVTQVLRQYGLSR